MKVKNKLLLILILVLLISGCSKCEFFQDRFEYCKSLGYEATLLATDYTNDFYCVNIEEDKSIGNYEYINGSDWRFKGCLFK